MFNVHARLLSLAAFAGSASCLILAGNAQAYSAVGHPHAGKIWLSEPLPQVYVLIQSDVLTDEGFMTLPNETLFVAGDVTIEARGPVELLGPVVARKGSAATGGIGASIRIVSETRIYSAQSISAGGGEDSSQWLVQGGASGVLVLAAPRIEFGVPQVVGENGGKGGPAAHGGHGASYEIFADRVIFPRNTTPMIRAGDGGDGGRVADLVQPTLPFSTTGGGGGGNGGYVVFRPFHVYAEQYGAVDRVGLVYASRGWSRPLQNGTNGDPGADGNSASGQPGADAAPPEDPCEGGKGGGNGPAFTGGNGGHGGDGGHATGPGSNNGGNGGRGGNGGQGNGGPGGSGASGASCCPPAADPAGPAGAGGKGGRGGNGTGGKGGDGGKGGNPSGQGTGGHGGNAGNGGDGNGGSGGKGGSGGPGLPGGPAGLGGDGGTGTGGLAGVAGVGGGYGARRSADGAPGTNGTGTNGPTGPDGGKGGQCTAP